MGRPAINLIGKKFGRWEVLSRDLSIAGKAGKHVKWLCKCECGVERSVSGVCLTQNNSYSCGCLQRELVTSRNTKHGLYGTKVYENYISSIKRARRLRATPKWANLDKIREIYRNCPIGYEVDHIIPLCCKQACGFHCESNLQYLTPKDNQSKKNKLPIELESA